MDVKVSDAYGTREMSLDDYLTPHVGSMDSRGAIEDAQRLADKNATAIGRILARMVERELMTFDEAESAAGEYNGKLLK